jgi:hypothetical protein
MIMENIFNTGDYIAEQAKTLPQLHSIENVGFYLLPIDLDEALLEAVKACSTYTDMVLLAADSGLAYYDGSDEALRVVDNKGLTKKIEDMWSKGELKLDTDPCLKERVGLVVCEISGLSELLEERKLEDEIKEEDRRVAEAKKFLDDEEKLKLGDYKVPAGTDLDNMSPEQMAQHHKDNAAA